MSREVDGGVLGVFSFSRPPPLCTPESVGLLIKMTEVYGKDKAMSLTGYSDERRLRAFLKSIGKLEEFEEKDMAFRRYQNPFNGCHKDDHDKKIQGLQKPNLFPSNVNEFSEEVRKYLERKKKSDLKKLLREEMISGLNIDHT